MASVGPAVYPGTPTTITYAGLIPGATTYPGEAAIPGPILVPEDNLYPGPNTYPGQGLQPLVRVRYSTDDASVATPSWTEVASSEFRSFSTSRGRESELSEINAGTATVVVDNRERVFDPALHPEIRPNNQWWLYEEFSGEIQDIFRGWADSYDQTWPGGMDAEAVVQLTDEFKVLAGDELPTTNPPRSSFEELVKFDRPSGFWRMDDHETSLIGKSLFIARSRGLPAELVLELKAAVGKPLQPSAGTIASSMTTAIVGDRGNSVTLSAGAMCIIEGMSDGDSGDAGGVNEMTLEFWVRLASGLPSASELLVAGPGGAGVRQYKMLLNPSGSLSFTVWGVSGTVTATGGALTAESTRWYHIVGTITGGFIILYVDGVQVGAAAWADTIKADTPVFQIGDGGNGQQYGFDEVAVYRHGLDAERIGAHFTAARSRGFIEQRSDVRVGAVLDSVGSQAPRSLGVGIRSVLPAFMEGQAPLEEMRSAMQGENVDAVLFIARDGTATFLPDGHRSSSPYNTVQATFDDDGTDLPYLDVDVDYSESFLYNQVNGTRDGGTLQTVTDATSIARYFRHVLSLPSLPNISDANVLTIVTALLAKHKDPMQRITRLTLTTDEPAVTEAVFRRDIGDKIRVFRTPPGGGARIDQTVWVQSVKVEGANDGKPWRIQLGLSPL
jgi:hypothetical protein